MLVAVGGYNYTVGTKHGFFRPDLLWPIAMGGMYIFCLLILLYVIQQRLQVYPPPPPPRSPPCSHACSTPSFAVSIADFSTAAKEVHLHICIWSNGRHHFLISQNIPLSPPPPSLPSPPLLWDTSLKR